jgi:hypothetical protein
MVANSKIPWPQTYLGRLQAVTDELKRFDEPVEVEKVLERFSGVTGEQIVATLAALILFGRVDRNGDLYSVPKKS